VLLPGSFYPHPQLVPPVDSESPGFPRSKGGFRAS